MIIIFSIKRIGDIMKKFWIYFSLSIFVCFILPALLTKQEVKTYRTPSNIEENKQNKIEEEKNSDNNKYNYEKYGKIKLLHKETGEIEEVLLDTYLCNVISAEMPADYEIEALKAQAVVARTYTIYKCQNPKHENADICDDSSCCQAWVSKEKRFERWEEENRESNWAKIENAVNETSGKIITYDRKTNKCIFSCE